MRRNTEGIGKEMLIIDGESDKKRGERKKPINYFLPGAFVKKRGAKLMTGDCF